MKCVSVSVSVSQSEYVILCWVHVHLSVYWSVSSLPLDVCQPACVFTCLKLLLVFMHAHFQTTLLSL